MGADEGKRWTALAEIGQEAAPRSTATATLMQHKADLRLPPDSKKKPLGEEPLNSGKRGQMVLGVDC